MPRSLAALRMALPMMVSCWLVMTRPQRLHVGSASCHYFDRSADLLEYLGPDVAGNENATTPVREHMNRTRASCVRSGSGAVASASNGLTSTPCLRQARRAKATERKGRSMSFERT